MSLPLLLVVLLVITMVNTELTEAQVEILESVSKGTTGFALDLYNVLKAQPGNLFFSPLSLQLVLALAYTGAKSSTAAEIAKSLLLPAKLDDLLEGYSLLLNLLDDPSLSVANKMFIEESFQILADFQSNADKYFKASAGLVPFKSNCDMARNKINSWVESKTNNKIKELLAQGVLTAESRIVLVNAIHFKADWSVKFEEKNTQKKPFYVSKTETVDTDMMHMTKKLAFLHDDELKVKALKLSYAKSDLEMLILLPDEIDGLAALESKLSTVNLSEKFRYFGRPEVKVQLPKFKLETTMDLNDILKKMGMQTMFGRDADFSGISSEMLIVSSVIQKAFVEVNEKGTEAAAATVMAIRMRRSLDVEEKEEFIADHPFLFYIINNARSVVVLFMGRYAPTCVAEVEGDSHEEL